MIKEMIQKTSDTFWTFIDNRYIVRRAVLAITIWMSYISYVWAAEFATNCTKPGLEVAAIIAAVLTPISALQGFVFKLYLETKGEK